MMYILYILSMSVWGFLVGSVIKNLPANAGDMGSIPGSGRFPGEGNGNQLGKFHGQRRPAGSIGSQKSQRQL